MDLHVVGDGFTAAQTRAVQAGLDAMGAPDTRVEVVDDFVGTVRRVTDQPGYGVDRGPGIVAARTIRTVNGPVIIVNAPEVRRRDPEFIERLFAHEGGHVRILGRGEDATGRRHLVDSQADWEMLHAGLAVLDEFRVERALNEIGYPADEIGTMEDLGNCMHGLNCEIMNAVTTDSNVLGMMTAVFAAYEWFAKRLACVIAHHPAATPPDCSTFTQNARENWDDYAAGHWTRRSEFCASVPGALTAVPAADMDRMLVEGAAVEAHLLNALGFRYSVEGRQLTFRRTGSDALFARRWRRAVAEIQASA